MLYCSNVVACVAVLQVVVIFRPRGFHRIVDDEEPNVFMSSSGEHVKVLRDGLKQQARGGFLLSRFLLSRSRIPLIVYRLREARIGIPLCQ